MYEELAKRGHADACLRAAEHYQFEPNVKPAVANGGEGKAFFKAGYLYSQCIGGIQDKAKACYWYEKSYVFRPKPGTALNLALCCRSLGYNHRACFWAERSVKFGPQGEQLYESLKKAIGRE